MANVAAQAIYELSTLGRLTPETDYAVREELDLVSDEEREEHDKNQPTDDKPDATKATASTAKKGN